jgi:hypothetical protein
MQNRYTTGALLHGEFSSADASGLSEANARILLYGAGSTTAVTLDSNDNVVITDVLIVAAAALTVTVYDGANNTVGAGEVVAKGSFPANGGAALNFSAPHVCQKGTWPKVLTSGAGQIDVYIKGYIYRTGA